MSCFRLVSSLVFAVCFSLAAQAATAATAVSASEQSASRIKTASAVAALGPDLFGEQVSLYSGSTEFNATDLALPGNGTLAVALSRRLSLDTNRVRAEPGDTGLWTQYPLGDWEIDLPYLTGTYSNDGWVVGGNTPGFSDPNARCSAPTTREEFGPNDIGDGVRFMAGEFWNGISFRSPGGGERPVLFRSSDVRVPKPGDALATRLTTSDNWYFTCLPRLASSQGGEGFVAHGPDGTKIFFDYMVELEERPVSKYWRNSYSYEEVVEIRRSLSQSLLGLIQLPHGGGIHSLPDAPTSNGGSQPLYKTFSRKTIRIYPSRIEDRFGNAVAYEWAAGRLNKIRSIGEVQSVNGVPVSAERQITLVYNAGNLLESASDGVRHVSYLYQGGALKSVTLPDMKQWTFDSTELRSIQRYISPANLLPQYIEWDVEYTCAAARRRTGQTGALTITHPSGATGRFDFGIARHVRSDIDPAIYCNSPVYIGNDLSAFIHFQSLSEDTSLVSDQVTVPIVFDTLALASKKITGVGIPAQGHVWSYSYENRVINAGGILTNGKRRVVVTEPQGRLELTFGAGFMIDEGQLLEVRRVEGDRLLERTVYDYADRNDAQAMGLPDTWGLTLAYDQDAFGNLFRPQTQASIHRDGVVFNSQTTSFNSFLQPTGVQRWSTYSDGARDTAISTTTYENNLSIWAIGLVTKQSLDGREVSRTTYDQQTGLPLKNFSYFGAEGDEVAESTFTYYGDGTLESVADAAERRTTFSEWYRGVPKRIQFNDDTATSATVTNAGWILSTTDDEGNTTSYTYDPMGRVQTITPPAGGGWLATSFSFLPVAGPGYAWRHTQARGNYVKETFLDALLRPVLTHDYDTGSANSHRYTRRQFDYQGRETFVSYPGRTADAPYGTSTIYDALGRPLVMVQQAESEGPVIGQLMTRELATYFEYLSDFRTRVVSPRGHATTTSFQTFDSPDTSRPVTILAPQGRTDIARDNFGNPLSLIRSGQFDGSPMSLERTYVYDSQMRLCKRIEPESGATVFSYNALGAVAWSAEGTNLTGETCADRDSVPLGDRVVRGYDDMNRLSSVLYPDNSQNLGFTYEFDGQVSSAAAGGVLTQYQYNNLRMLESETLSLDGQQYQVGYGYDGSGALNALTYPDGTSTAFAPNAFGQPTQVGAYATTVSYDPAGAIEFFIYGNGIKHHGQANVRQLPYNIHYELPDLTWIYTQDLYYDDNANVERSEDLTDARVRSKTMGYDSADRLVSVQAGASLGGNESFSYDPLDNIRMATRGSQQRAYSYTPQNHLQSVTRAGESTLTFTHDPKGRVTQRNGVAIDFDSGNRVRNVGTSSYLYDAQGRRVRRTEAGVATHFLYSQAGQLLYERNPSTGEKTRHHYLGNRLVAKVSDQAGPLAIPVLTAPAASSGTHTVTWTAVTGATRYVLEEQFNSGAWMPVQDSAALSRVFTSKPQGLYGYRVSACTASSCGQYSYPANTLVQSVPVLTLPSASSTGTYTIDWTAVSGATSYRLQEQLNDGAWKTTKTTSALGFSVVSKVAGAYQYRVCALTGTVCGAYSAVKSISVGALASPSISPSTAIPSSYTVSWPAVAGSISYRVQEKIGAGAWTQVQSSAALSLARTNRPAGTYAYRVRSCKDSTCSVPQSPAVSKVVEAATVVTAPASSVTGTFDVQWPAVPGASTYRLEEQHNGGAWVELRNSSSLRQSMYRKGAGSRSYRVTACVDLGCGTVSAVATVQVAPAPTLSAPGTSNTGAYTVTWAAVPGAASYRLEERTGTETWRELSFGSALALAVSGRTTADYSYRVSACLDADDCGSPSAVSVTQVVLPPAVPVLSAPATDGDGSFTVYWTPDSAASSFRLEERSGEGEWAEVFSGPATSFTVVGKAAGQYSYRARGCNLSCSDYSPEKTVWVLPKTAPLLSGPPSSSGSHSISWAPVNGASRYELQESVEIIEEGMEFFQWADVHNSPATTAALTGRATKVYKYRARACSVACGPYSTSFFRVVVTNIVIGTPSLGAPASSASGDFAVTWSAVSNATRYELEEQLNSGAWVQVANQAGVTFTASGRPDGSYSYRARGCDAGSSCGSYSAIVTTVVAQVPPVPTMSAPASSDNGSYTVSWSAVGAGVTYRLEERVASGSWTALGETTGTSQSFTARPNASYSYRVLACFASGSCSGYSAVATTVVTILPAAPSLTAPATNATSSYTVNWSSVASAALYRLEERTNGGAWLEVWSGTATGSTLSGRGIWLNEYRVRACSDGAVGSCGAYSNVAGTQVDLAPVASATLPNASGGFTLNWSAVAGANGYRLEQQVDGGGWVQVQDSPSLSLVFPTKPAASYAYRVRACAGANCASYSNVVAVAVKPASAPNLAGPGGTSATGAYLISWTAINGATSYRLEEKRDPGLWMEIYNAGGTSAALSGRVTGTYSYRVMACNSGGCSAFSSSFVVTVALAPTDVPVVSVPAVSGNGSFIASWTSVGGSTSYQVEEQVNGGGWTPVQDAVETVRVVNGYPNGTYGYRVRACNSGNCGAYSATATVQVVIVPGAASLSTPTSSSSGSYTVSWTAVGTATSYRLEESVSGVWNEVANTAATSQAFSGKAENTYGYRVRACNAGGCGVYSNTQSTVVALPVTGVSSVTVPASDTTGIYNVSWAAVSRAATYRLEEQVNGGAWTLLYEIPATSTSMSSKPSGTYSYRVQACNPVGCGPVSAASSVVVQLPAVIPPVPQALSAISQASPKLCIVNWFASTGATSYELRGNTVLVYTGPSLTYRVNNVCGSQYTVRACNSSGCSAWSAPAFPGVNN